MTGRLKILAREIKRRVLAGEDRDTVLDSYKLLSEAERQAILDCWDDINT